MLDKPERNMLFPGEHVNFSSLVPETSHFQNADIMTSSYFVNMDIVEETPNKKKCMSLNNEDNSVISSVISGNSQYYDKDKFSVGQKAQFDNINKVLLSNLRPAYFQQKEPSLFHETYKEEIANVRNIEHLGSVRQLEQHGYQTEYGHELVNTLLLDQDKQQQDMLIPHSPIVFESSTSEKASLEKEKLKNNAFVSKVLESIYLRKQDALTHGHKNQPLVERSLYANSNLNSERFSMSGDGFSGNIDENNPTDWRLSPIIYEKIWDGPLKLNATTTVSIIAFFKSGEKIQDLNWPDQLEIKGKVRLHAFEKFIQELPRSRNRALMVTSLRWKLGSCQRALAGMMEVAKGYKETERVGFVQIPPGIDLYVCPRSDAIITILAKYGFFKGMAAVEDDQDSLIGCVVWRRGQSSANLLSQTAAEGKKALVQEQPLKTTGLSNGGINSPAVETSASEKNVMLNESEHKAALELPGSEAAKAIAVTETKCLITESTAATSCINSLHASIFHSDNTVQTITSIPYSCPLVPTQQNTCERPSLSLLQENVKPPGVIPPAESTGVDKADLVSDSWTRIVSPSEMAPVTVLQNSLSSCNSQRFGMFGSVPAPGPRPLIPVDSSNFQFRPQLVQKSHSSLSGDGNGGSDLSCFIKDLGPSFQPAPPHALPGPPPLPIEFLQSLIQFKKNVPEATIKGRMLQDKTHIMHHVVTTGPVDILDTRAPSITPIQKNCGGSNDDHDDDDDDLPEFDFNSACEEQPDAPFSRFRECTQQSHFPVAAPSLSEKPSLKTANGKSFEAFQHRHMPSPVLGNLSCPNERPSIAETFGENVSKKPSTWSCQLRQQLSRKELGSDPRGFNSKRKGLWDDDDDDDDDMPEWCPPDLELPEPPLLSGRTLPPPPSFHPSQSRDSQQMSRPGLLGPFPSSAAPECGYRRSSKPPLGSHRANSGRPRAGKFKVKRRNSCYDAERKRRRR